MNADIERLKMLLTETISLLCQRGLTYRRELRVQGLLGITVDGDVFLIPVERTFSDSKQQPACINHGTDISAAHDAEPQQNDSAVNQVAKSAVHHAKDDPTNNQPVPPAEYPVVDNNQPPPLSQYPAVNNSQPPALTQYPVVDNSRPDLLTVTKTEVVDDIDVDSHSENEMQMLSVEGASSEYFSASEPVSRPFQAPHSFPTEACAFPTDAFGFGNSSTPVQTHPACGEMKFDGKRKRKQSTFGDDMLVLSPDNDEWTNNSLRAVDVPAPVAGCSYWTDFGDARQLDASAVSVFFSPGFQKTWFKKPNPCVFWFLDAQCQWLSNKHKNGK